MKEEMSRKKEMQSATASQDLKMSQEIKKPEIDHEYIEKKNRLGSQSSMKLNSHSNSIVNLQTDGSLTKRQDQQSVNRDLESVVEQSLSPKVNKFIYRKPTNITNRS